MKYVYTIKNDPEKGIYLVNEQGAEVAATDILDKCGEARVFAFDGKMGAGKTTFIKCLCEAMGTEDVVNSPTFAIVNVYEVGAIGDEAMRLLGERAPQNAASVFGDPAKARGERQEIWQP